MFKKMLALGGNAVSIVAKDKKKSSKQKGESSKLPSLPANFADEVFNLELEIEHSDLDIAHVTRLLELYAIGIEYYESIKSDKYQIFKNKTRQLLLKQNVNHAMDKATEELKTDPDIDLLDVDLKKESMFDDSQMKHRQKELELSVKYIQQQDTKESVKSLLDTHSQDIRQNQMIIQHDTDKQKNLILQRLKQRKVKKQGNVESEENESDVQQKKLFEIKSDDSELEMDIVDITTGSQLYSQQSSYTSAAANNQGYHGFYSLIDSQHNDTFSTQSYSFTHDANVTAPKNKQIELEKAAVIATADQAALKSQKKKVRVSQKSVMEFQMQNSIIPF